MNKSQFLGRGAALAGALAIAVTSVGAQSVRSDQAREQMDRSRPRVWALDGRGAQIGVTIEDAAEGVRIGDVDADGPASKAGLLEGDIVVEVDGERVRSARQFSRLIQETAEGRSVALVILRGGERHSLMVRPESRAFDFNLEADLGRRLREMEPRLRELEPRLRDFRFDGPFVDMLPRLISPRARLGVQLSELTPQLAEYFGATDGGVLVTSVTAGSPAEKAGLKAGDVITSIDGDRVRRTEDVVDELRDKDGEVTVGFLRDKKESAVKATIEDSRPRTGFRRPA